MLERLSRRAALVLGAGAGLEALSACTPEIFPPWELIYRASDLRLRNNLGYGQGSLILEQGKFVIHTVQHVADLMRKDPSSAVVEIPELFGARLDPSKFMYDPQTNDFESSAFYEINQEYTEKIQKAIEAGELTYLKRIKPGFLFEGSAVGMPRPDTKKNTVMTVAGYDAQHNLYELKGLGIGIICEGRSGGPVLRRTLTGVTTNQTYGVVSAIDPNESQPDIYTAHPNVLAGCSSRAYFRPNP